MNTYDAGIDGYRLGWPAKIGYGALGFAAGVPGILAAWALARRKRMMECSAEAIYLAIIGWALAFIAWFVATAAGLAVPGASLIELLGLGALGAALGWAGVVWPASAGIDGWAIFWLVAACLFIVLSSMWVYGLRYKQTPTEKARVFHGDDWIKPGEKHLRYDSAITIDATPEKIWPYIRQCGQERAGWYSFDWLERLCTFDIHNHYDIHPE